MKKTAVKPDAVMRTVRVPSSVYQDIEQVAKKERRSVQAQAEVLLRAALSTSKAA